MDLALQVGAFVGILYHLTVGTQFHYDRGGTDITPLFDGLVGRQERLMLHQLETAGVIHQRITGNPRFGMVRPRETTVDHQRL